MKKYWKSMLTALVCFLIVIILNFILPRMLPGNPIAYLSGFAEEDMSSAQVERYTEALHLNEHEAARWLSTDELGSVRWLPADKEVIRAHSLV